MGTDQKVNILLVDDRPENLMVIEAILADLGHNLVLATSGREALRWLLKQDFAVILLDVQMPEMDGFETARLIRERERSRLTPIIFITAADKSEPGVFKGYSVGAADYLFKPVTPEILRAKIAVFVDLDKMRQSLTESESHLRHLNATLEQAVLERTAKLAKANEALEEELVERERIEERMRRQLGRLALLHELTRAIGERQDLASIFLIVLGRLEREMPVAFAAVLLRDPHTQQLQVHTVGPGSRALAEGMGFAEQVVLAGEHNGLERVLAGQTVYESDTVQVPLPFAQQLAGGGLRAVVVAPLQVRSEVFGLLVVAHTEAGAFSSVDGEFLRQLSEHVAVAVRQVQLYSEVQQAYEEVRQTQQLVVQQERLRALGQLASGIAHDINNAITPAALYVEDVVHHEAGLSAQGREELGVVQTAIQDVIQTVGRLREFYRKPDPLDERVPVDLNALVRQGVELTRARWRDQVQRQGVEIRVVVQLAEGEVSVRGNAGEVRELLVNLILNAVDAMPQGGTLTIATYTTATGGVLEVRDEGVGMDEETQRRCVEPFYTTKGERGTGLGLAMVYGIVQRHEGQLEITSVVGQGTVVRVVFPPLGAVAEKVGVGRGEVGKGQVVRILLIDDEPLIRQSMGEVLRRWGHEVVVAASGAEGLAVFYPAGAAEPQFEVVITDLGMPQMDGKEVARRIKERSPQVGVILLTGWGQQMSAERSPHVDLLLSKPPQLADLQAALATVTKRSSEG